MGRRSVSVAICRLWCCAAGGAVGLTGGTSSGVAQAEGARVIPITASYAASGAEHLASYSHIFVIIAENKSYERIIGPNSVAPNINRLAQRFGIASQFFAEAHPSEPNYIAMLAGDTFGIHDDDAFYCKPGMHDTWCPKALEVGYVDHTVAARSLMDQLQARGLTWKAYMESLPEAGSLAARWPTSEHPLKGVPEQMYAAKHNGFLSFLSVQQDPKRGEKIVDFAQLDRDLSAGRMPNYAHIVPNQCNDMHGRDAGPEVPSDCVKSNPDGLIARGDRVIGELVQRIMSSALWSAAANAAIVITFDENDKEERHGADQGCCGSDPKSAANFGGGRIPTIVITNHGPRGLVDGRPYNHYSLLRATEEAFGIDEYLGHAADASAGVVSMTPLFAVSR
jgi:phosphatidylinositol-3-phosphatase